MAQVTGFPGGGIRLSKSIVILTGVGSPNASTTPDVQNAGLGSLYLQEDVLGLWICSVAAQPATNTSAATVATWQQISVP